MFERYTEKARRVIFFARYEASQCGSPSIDTEHLLLGLLREDQALVNRFLRPQGAIDSLRKEIESRITIRQRFSTSVEVPLSQESKRILNHAFEEAERLGHRHVGTEHLLLGILREEKSLGAQLLHKRGLRLAELRDSIRQGKAGKAEEVKEAGKAIGQVVERLVNAWSRGDIKTVSGYFAEEAEFVDLQGFLWKRRIKIEEALTAIHSSRYKMKEGSPATKFLTPDVAVVRIVWEKASELPDSAQSGIHMMLVITEQDSVWLIVTGHATKIIPPPPTS